ncbi:glucose-6-phosphate isomerase [Thermodesulforhabdus norvegica]|uniref:Glucose-6-phosphate isomerase n=1 Tax=Thermodesulforhabdus norvegica TaxID=39841 RepID=A0A1I4SNI8_9BACT|nr:glucose-6-phosphate isomerase [Thermodesulforhabdus norvegica]SFM65957.1 glucose-6-phosphate isomerase [Thermodesulforhabdus norvegica]
MTGTAKGMIGFDWAYCRALAVGVQDGIADEDVERWLPEARKVHERILKERESGLLAFWDIIEDEKVEERVLEIAEHFKGRLVDNIVVLGIGGSALGAQALFDALVSPFYNLTTRPRFFVLDNIDPLTFSQFLDMVDLGRTVFVVISKSGTTAETLSQFLIVKERVVSLLGREALKKHFVVVTDPDKGVLRSWVRESGVLSCDIPPGLGGRFSVLSAVGLVPAALLGLDIRELREGARAMAALCETASVIENPAYCNGLYHVIADLDKGKNIHVYWAYSDSLYSFADWLRQLIAESLGKKVGEKLYGPTPVKARGVTDQHSQLQLYREGPNNKIITFIGVKSWPADVDIPPAEEESLADAGYLGGKKMGELFHAEQRATAWALAEAGRPNITLWFPQVTPYTIGQAFFLYELQTVFMGYLYGVNPFDQPGVELSKKMTYGLMGRKGFEEFVRYL